MYYYVNYADPANRTLKVQIDGTVGGYTFKQMNAWRKKWEGSDPADKLRRSFRYQQKYREIYVQIGNIQPGKRIYKKNPVEALRLVEEMRQKILIDGLTICVDMFERIQKQMDPSEPYYNNFIWETKVLFFAYFDFCIPPKKPELTQEEQIAKWQKDKEEGLDPCTIT